MSNAVSDRFLNNHELEQFGNDGEPLELSSLANDSKQFIVIDDANLNSFRLGGNNNNRASNMQDESD